MCSIVSYGTRQMGQLDLLTSGVYRSAANTVASAFDWDSSQSSCALYSGAPVIASSTNHQSGVELGPAPCNAYPGPFTAGAVSFLPNCGRSIYGSSIAGTSLENSYYACAQRYDRLFACSFCRALEKMSLSNYNEQSQSCWPGHHQLRLRGIEQGLRNRPRSDARPRSDQWNR